MTLRFPLAAALLLGACADAGPGPAGAIVLDSAALAALPELRVEPGVLVCTALGQDGCPLRAAVANRLADGGIALWEPGLTVHRFGAGDTAGTPLGQAGPGGSYLNAMAIASTGADRYRVVTYDGEWRALTLDASGEVRATELITNPGPLAAMGFVGSQPVLQRMRGWGGDTAGHLQVILLDRILDTAGTMVLDAPVPWLTGGTADLPPLPPLVASNPVWTLTDDGDLLWSPGDQFVVERRTRRGRVVWRLEGPASRAATTALLDAREALLRTDPFRLPPSDEEIAAMRSRSDSLAPAVMGITATPDARVIVSRGIAPDGSEVEFLRLAADGTPDARFRLGQRTKILLAEGDSLLVHMPTEGEPWEVRWVRLKQGN